MKKIYIAMAAMLAAALTSCQMEEQSFKNEEFSPNTVVFGVGRTAGTKAAGPAVISRQNISSMGDVEVDGYKLFLEETVTILDETPATKGTPAYTENVGTLYGNKLGVYSDNTKFGDATYEKMDNVLQGGGWRYQHNYATNPWPDEETAVDFYFRMPTDMSGIGEGGFTYAKSGSAQTISFSYTSPASAAEQQDILFGARSASKANYTTSLPNGIPVLLNHALTGVKFALADDIKATIMIDSVSFIGLIDKGSCVVTPASEGNYRDNITNYSSSASGVVVWKDTTRTGSTHYANYTDTVTYAKNTAGSFTSAGDYPKSFANGGNSNNLDDADGNAAQTFWLIPQKLTAQTRLTIHYVVKASANAATGTPYEFTIDFGKVLEGKSVEWKAGELHTYTIRVDDVNVKIEDTVTATEKSGVTITNTGNTAAFIRAALVGQWLNSDDNPVFGFTDKVNNLYLVDSWYQDQFVTKEGASAPARTHGKFEELAGYDKDNGYNDWYLCTDGYYYYKYAVEPTYTTGSSLFSKYTVGTTPSVEIAGVDTEVYFVLEIATQAVTAKQLDGSYYEANAGQKDGWQLAWKNATGTAPTVQQ